MPRNGQRVQGPGRLHGLLALRKSSSQAAPALSKAQALQTQQGNTTRTRFLPQKSEQMLPQREPWGSV